MVRSGNLKKVRRRGSIIRSVSIQFKSPRAASKTKKPAQRGNPYRHVRQSPAGSWQKPSTAAPGAATAIAHGLANGFSTHAAPNLATNMNMLQNMTFPQNPMTYQIATKEVPPYFFHPFQQHYWPFQQHYWPVQQPQSTGLPHAGVAHSVPTSIPSANAGTWAGQASGAQYPAVQRQQQQQQHQHISFGGTPFSHPRNAPHPPNHPPPPPPPQPPKQSVHANPANQLPDRPDRPDRPDSRRPPPQSKVPASGPHMIPPSDGSKGEGSDLKRVGCRRAVGIDGDSGSDSRRRPGRRGSSRSRSSSPSSAKKGERRSRSRSRSRSPRRGRGAPPSEEGGRPGRRWLDTAQWRALDVSSAKTVSRRISDWEGSCPNSDDRRRKEKWLEGLRRIPFGRSCRGPRQQGSAAKTPPGDTKAADAKAVNPEKVQRGEAEDGEIGEIGEIGGGPADPEGAFAASRRDLESARSELDSAVVGMEDAKRRVLVAAAERRLASGRGAPLLLVGPPGVGKTTLARHGVAPALGTRLVQISMGGLEDSTVLRGSQEVYLGATHGLLADALIRAECDDPVILLDEVDKISAGARGRDVTSTLLHAMDPTQSACFEDTYFAGVHLDLSKVQWVLTANGLEDVPAALLDRCEVVRLDPPTDPERRRILTEHALPRAGLELGLAPGSVALSDSGADELLAIGGEGLRGPIRALRDVVRAVAMELRLGRGFMRRIGLPVPRGSAGSGETGDRPLEITPAMARALSPGGATGGAGRGGSAPPNGLYL